MARSPYAIETKGLTKYYGKHPAVLDLDLRVPHSLVFGFLGISVGLIGTLLLRDAAFRIGRRIPGTDTGDASR